MKNLTYLLVISLIAGSILTGCGNGDDETTPSTTLAPSASATPAPGASATPAPGASATPAPGASATPAPGASATPAPSATPSAKPPVGGECETCLPCN